MRLMRFWRRGRRDDELGDELNFDAPGLRRIATVGDVLDFIEQLQSA